MQFGHPAAHVHAAAIPRPNFQNVTPPFEDLLRNSDSAGIALHDIRLLFLRHRVREYIVRVERHCEQRPHPKQLLKCVDRGRRHVRRTLLLNPESMRVTELRGVALRCPLRQPRRLFYR